MAKLILTLRTVARGRLPVMDTTLEDMQKEDPATIAFRCSDDRTVIERDFDAYLMMQREIDAGRLATPLTLMQMIANWREFNRQMKAHIATHSGTYYKSKQLFWRFEY